MASIIERIGSGCVSNLMRVLIRLTASISFNRYLQIPSAASKSVINSTVFDLFGGIVTPVTPITTHVICTGKSLP